MSRQLVRTADGQPMVIDRVPGPHDAPAVVLLHGWTCRRGYWSAQLAHLENRYPLLAPDLPGHGHTAAPDRSSWTLEGLVADVLQMLRDTRTEDAVLVGHSMGGAVALEVAAWLGAQVRGIVLVDTFLIDYGGLDAEARKSLYVPFRADMRAALANMVNTRLGPDAPAELRRQLAVELPETPRQVALPLWKSLLAWQPLETLTTLRCRIHAINGAFIPESARARVAPYMTEEIMSHAGHFPQMEDPEGFNTRLDAALSRLQAPSALECP